MPECILAALEKPERIDDVLPYLKSVASPGVKVVFLVRTAISDWGAVESHLTMIETGNLNEREYLQHAWRFNIEREKQRVEKKLAPARATLRLNDVGTEINIYTGSLSRAVRKFTASGTVRLLILPNRLYPVFATLHKILAALRLSGQCGLPHVVLLRSACIRGVFK